MPNTDFASCWVMLKMEHYLSLPYPIPKCLLEVKRAKKGEKSRQSIRKVLKVTLILEYISAMILTTIYRPTSLLAEYVQCFYFNESEDFEYEGLAEPSIYQELFFNFGDKFELRNAEGQATYSRNWLSGIRSKALKVHTSGKHLSAGVIFKPWGLYAAFQIDARQICNVNMVQEDVLKLDSDFVSSEISANAFFDFIEEALIKSLKKSRLTATMQGIIKGLEQENLRTILRKTTTLS